MPFVKSADVAMFAGADWAGLRKTVPGCTPEEARRIAMLDPESRFFFFCRDGMVLENPEWPEPRIFNPGDAVFFSGEPWWGSAPQCDGYQKDGLSLAYMGNITKTPPLVAGEYATAQGLNAVDVVCLFAANLATSVPYGYVQLAPDVPVPAGGTFAIGGDGFPEVFAQSVAPLQAKGLTVLLTLLNNHDQAGWSAFDPDTEVGQSNCANLVAQLKSIVDRYGFDGIDIDDEYSDGPAYPASLAMVTSMMREAMPGKIVSKALWDDQQYFGPAYQGTTLAANLVYGWYMGYGSDPSWILPTYAGYGMSPLGLAMGYWTDQPATPPTLGVEWLKANGYAGYMVYAGDDAPDQALLGQLVDAWSGPGNWNRSG